MPGGCRSSEPGEILIPWARETVIFLLGEPKSTQHIYHSVCRGRFPNVYMTPEGKALKEAYQWQAKAQWKGAPLAGDMDISVTLYFGTKRRADFDNFNKLSLDALTGTAYEDDSQIAALHLYRAHDKLRPRIEVSIVG
jgi:Holliday junction resolvase RusA-like endonuclease